MQSCNHQIRLSLKASDQLDKDILYHTYTYFGVHGLSCCERITVPDNSFQPQRYNHLCDVVRSHAGSNTEVSRCDLSALTIRNLFW